MTSRAPVILVGAQRSGTTALARALSQAFHDRGGHFTVNGKLPYLLHRWLGPDDLAARHLRVDEILYALDRRPPAGAGVAQWRARVERSLRAAARAVADGEAGDDPIALARTIMAESNPGTAVWGDKYNEYLLQLPQLERIVPGARYIMLFRNPEEVADSVLSWHGDRPWAPTTREAARAKWTAWNARWLEFADGVDPGRRIVLEYRALCRGEETDRLEAFLGHELKPYLADLEPRKPPKDCPEHEWAQDTVAVWRALCRSAV